jgi:8-oxo-dGTP diphosphatase
MNAPRHREVGSAILIDTLGRFLFQQRDDIPGILHPGKVGLFGGHRESGESYLQCVVREVLEETTYYVPPGDFAHLATYDDVDDDGGTVHGEFFVTNDIPIDRLLITEGALSIVKLEDISSVQSRFSPSARFALQAFFHSNNRFPSFSKGSFASLGDD